MGLQEMSLAEVQGRLAPIWKALSLSASRLRLSPYPVIHAAKCEVFRICKFLVLDNVFHSVCLVFGEAVGEVNSLTMT